ncbi:MAG: Thioredoxin [uncultured Phycisphaerae bacterium]|uniref:Thioredoxin n=1 Tax=uncultured Phycisphaerae bacterium TaxID=904963 RepID=A0A6J4PY91_9BACT|nr:MAG: Thioredoxin [uncultured Phycisphaerae bacterium]
MAIVECPNCGVKNRVDEQAAERLQPVCGRCKTRLAVPANAGNASAAAAGGGHPIEVTDATFERDVLGAGPTPVLLDCWAPWCGPCRMIAPIMEQLAAEAGGRFVVAKLNTDENRQVATRFQIDAIPTMLIFKNGQLIDRIVGLQPKQAIERKVLAYA